LTIPNERGVATTAVRVDVPAGIDFFLVENAPGWRTAIEKHGGKVARITFSGGSIPVDGFATFHFLAKNPVRSGTLVWDVRQSYAGGEVVDWTGPPGSDTPASRTTIAESAVPVDVIDVVSGGAAATAGGSPVASSGEAGHDTLALVLASAAVVVALGAAAAVALRGRPLA
jgi:uncharacterized protein YcnI